MFLTRSGGVHTIVVCEVPAPTGRWSSRRPVWSTWPSAMSRQRMLQARCTAGTALHGYAAEVAVLGNAGSWSRRWTAELLTCVFRTARPRDLDSEGAFVVSSAGRQQRPGKFGSSMRLCVSARVSDEDEARSYRRWRGGKGGS
jgi:hypothetical protein